MKKSLIFFVFLFCSFSVNLKAQGLLDVTENTRYEFNNYYKKIEADKTYFQKEIDITYFSFKNENQANCKILNTKIFDLCLNYVTTEAKFLGIIRQANLRLDVLNEMKSSKNYRYGRDEIQNPQLTSVSCDVVSVMGSQVFYEISFGFEAVNTHGNNDDDYKFEVKHYYLGNLQTGVIKPWKPTINAGNKAKIENLVAQKFKETYLTITKKLSTKEIEDIDYGDGEEEPVIKPEFVDVFKKADLTKADFYAYYNGIMIQYQEYSEGSKLYNGRFFRIFFPYEQALKIAAVIPEFSFLANKPKITSNIKNWTDENFANTKVGTLQQEPQILSLVSKNKQKPLVKTLTQTSYQISDDKSKRLMSKTITEFNANQDPVSVIVRDENGKLLSTAYYDYDANNRIKMTSSKGYNDEESFVTYEYSANNNLKTRTVVDESEIRTQYYFYNNNFIYAFSHSIFEEKNSNYIYQYEMKGDSFCIDKTCYLLNKEKEVEGIISPKTSLYQEQISRDSLGRIKEFHREDDRYNYYFEYDNQNRLFKYSTYENERLQQQVELVYPNEEKLPIMKTKTSISYSNITNLEDDYEWIYFE